MTAEALTVYETFRQSASRFPGRPFLMTLPETAAVYGNPAGEITYEQAGRRVDALIDLYRGARCGPGQRAGILLENRPDFLFHWLALNALGVSIVPINPDLRSAEIEYLVGHSEMTVAVATRARIVDLRNAAEAVGRPLSVVEPGEAPSGLSAPAPAGLDEDSECAVLYTSGTTGRPKGCLLPNEYFLNAGRWYAQVGGYCAMSPGEERMITPLPLFHMNALSYSVMATIMTGGCLINPDRFHPRSWWESVRESRATIVHYLGVMPAMLMGAPESPLDREHGVRFGFGAGVDRRLHAPFEERFGFPLVEAWAMTETGAGAVIAASREPRKIGTNCFGRPGPEMEIAILRDDGSPVDVDEPGELLVRRTGSQPRYGFFRAYLKDPAATSEAWSGGFFHTGDVVSRDADGDLHFIDRKKNVIRRSGENIAAVEVESVLKQHPEVVEVAVASVPDEVRGEEVFACIRLREPARDERNVAQDLTAYCLTRLAYYKAPGYIAFVERLPLTSTQKIQRGDLKHLAASLHAEGRFVDLRSMKKRST